MKKPFALSLIAAALLASGAARAADGGVDAATAQKLEQQIELMQQQLEAMKAQLQQLRQQNEALAAQQQQQAAQVQQVAAAGAESRPAGGISPDLSLWGYGEIYYTHPLHQPQDTTADLARAVFGIGYHFDERTVFNSEFEVEHAVASSDDQGEFEVEQFYVDRQLTDWAAVKGGLFLMPFGLLNEHHEPTNFYGVQRNFVETLVIPSTWREGGFAFHGDTPIGLTWDTGLTTTVNLGSWNPNPEDPLYRTALQLENNGVAPLQATHQELQFASAQHLAEYVSLNYKGIPGLLAGAAVFTGDSDTSGVAHPSRVTLWEGHARWTPGRADLSAVYARGGITDTAEYNTLNAGGSNPLPSKFYGWYLQGAYNVWQHNGYKLAPFARWERYSMGAGYEGIAPGFSTVPTGLAADGRPWPQPYDRIWTFGANFYLNPHVVLKADYQTYQTNSDFTRFDLGLGLAY
ncbi:MAG TPA: FlxA-like family protein [Nevskia sp.]|nr:FlxA-like family protein [Nevskia sp.]